MLVLQNETLDKTKDTTNGIEKMDQLKTICSRYLTSNMSLNFAIESLILSNFIDDSNLKRSSLEYIRDNSRDVIKTKDWIKLKKNYSELFDEIVLFSTNNYSIEAKIRWNLTQISKLKKTQWSPKTEIHELYWSICVSPEETTQAIEDQPNPSKYLKVGLSVERFLSFFCCNVRGELRIISIKEGIPDITDKFNETCRNRFGCEFRHLSDKLLDPNNGYIRDDTIILEANIIVGPPKFVHNTGFEIFMCPRRFLVESQIQKVLNSFS